MNMKLLVVVILVVFVHRTFGIDITFDPAKPAQGNSVTISCKRSSSSTASVLWTLDLITLTTCDGSTDNFCVPSPTGYTVSTDVSADIFNLSLTSVALTDCKTYTCTDKDTSSDTDSKDLSIAKYDSSEVVLTDPGTLSSGTISLTTGCLLSPSDVTISWKKVKQNGDEEDLDEVTPSQTTDATGCTDTCHSENSQKVVSSFVHNEYNESDFENVTFRAYIRHSSYPQDQTMKDSMKHKVKKAPPASDCACKSLNDCDIPVPVCILLWILIGLVIVGAGITGICLILHYCFDVKIPYCCKRKNTNSTAAEPQGTQNGEGQILHNRDTENSANYTKKRPPAKLEQLNEPGSEKHHIGGRPLPQIGKYN